MKTPLYRDFVHPRNYQAEGHAGLWYDRFFNRYDDSWSVPDGGKLEWIKTVTSSPLGGKGVREFCKRQKILIASWGGQSIVGRTAWHFATGLGNNHPVENGFAWHPTLGAPYLTGAAVKGLLRAWCEQWAGLDADTRRLWFGPSLDELKEKTAAPAVGGLIFFDAVPTGPVQLKADVMTPHYGKWYEEGGNGPAANGSNVPADWHDPVPVPFLTVAPEQSFLFSVALRPGCNIDLVNVLKELKNALELLGVGAKTAAGYGRMREDIAELKSLENEIKRESEEAARRMDEREAAAQMTPFELELHAVIRENRDPGQKEYVTLLKALESGRWTDSDKKMQVARKIKTLMQADKAWKEASSAKKPGKDRDYQNTLKVRTYFQPETGK